MLVAAVGFAGYAGWALLRHAEFQTGGYDLGIFEQAVRSYTEGRSPVSDLIAPGYLLPGDHFHPILVVLVPFYALWRGPETLLVVQSLLLATSAIPVTRCAIRQLGQRCGTVTGVGYVLSYGLLTAASFDFHEICFAVPLVALCGEHLLSGRWNAAVLCALPLILVKEDLPVTVAAVGVYLVLKRRLVLGSMTVLVGIGTSAFGARRAAGAQRVRSLRVRRQVRRGCARCRTSHEGSDTPGAARTDSVAGCLLAACDPGFADTRVEVRVL
ncbi:DUF2079 domain-containing protein [Amycolatopsis sp. NPDC050768]|uniref:DUF2079 domain-containing protein n=1 Tax=Amycolatopsis sp. NPDC050768 TaxID=3154839 RepID=UPI0033C8E2AE